MIRRMLFYRRFLPVFVLVLAAPEAHGYFANGKWPSTATDGATPPVGVPITLTWSIAADGVPIPGLGPSPGRPNNLAASFDALIGGTGASSVTEKPWYALIQDSFDRWEELSGVSFVYEPNDDARPLGSALGVLGVRGDIRLAGASIDGLGGALAQSGILPNGDIMFDTSETAYYGNADDNYLRFRHTLMHEIGHSLGLGHNESFNTQLLMAPTNSTAFDGPQFDDIRGVHHLYGDAFEKQSSEGNNSPATATLLGVVPLGGSARLGGDVPNSSAPVAPEQTDFVSVTNLADEDYFRFTLDGPATVDLTLTPTGRVYSERINPGSPYSTINPSRQSDLTLELFALAGETPTLLATASAAGLGMPEILHGLKLTEPSEYLVRVNGSTNNVQFYSLLIAAEALVVDPPALAGDFNQDGQVDAADYTVWRDLLGTNSPLANAPESPGFVDSSDYQTWRLAFGNSAATPGAAAVPEPAAGLVCLLLCTAIAVRRSAGESLLRNACGGRIG